MRIDQLGKLSNSYDPERFSPATRQQIEGSIADSFGLAVQDQRLATGVKYLGIGIVYVMTVITGFLAVAASVNAITLNDGAFERLWTTFGVGFTGAVVGHLKQAWKS